jgi:hypothetical protein
MSKTKSVLGVAKATHFVCVSDFYVFLIVRDPQSLPTAAWFLAVE